MLKPLLAVAALVVAWGTAPAMAQVPQPPAAEKESNVVGLAVYSSDGQKLGAVTQVGTAGGQQVVQAVFEDDGDGASTVVIPQTVFAQKPDRIELMMTAAEVKDTLSKQKKQQQQ